MLGVSTVREENCQEENEETAKGKAAKENDKDDPIEKAWNGAFESCSDSGSSTSVVQDDLDLTGVAHGHIDMDEWSDVEEAAAQQRKRKLATKRSQQGARAKRKAAAKPVAPVCADGSHADLTAHQAPPSMPVPMAMGSVSGPGSNGMRDDERYERRGNDIFWSNVKIGSVTEWRGSVGCHCSKHSSCKMPASRHYQTDDILIDWLLSAVNADGSTRLSKQQHADGARAIKMQTNAAGSVAVSSSVVGHKVS